jgi:hypothetical protein
LHFCFITERDIRSGDDAIKNKILADKRLWKQRALAMDSSRQAPSSFTLVLISPRVAYAAPDSHLRELAVRLQYLANWAPQTKDPIRNTVQSDFLYLKSPLDELFYGFQFNVDFFAASGDRRWWHDHRIPGGLAFTANSPGHMRQWREWYDQPEESSADRSTWFLQNAMFTIAHAHKTTPLQTTSEHALETQSGPTPKASRSPTIAPEGRVTWLRDLVDGKPLKNVACPFGGPIPKQLQGKDWTTYEGLLHTDHSIREEFFLDDDEPPTVARPYLMDFTYLYDKRQADYLNFMAGGRFSPEEVFKEIGDPSEWRVRNTGVISANGTWADAEIEIQNLLNRCQQWSEMGESST